jgi:uncharacterized membrane protein YvbJ
MAIKQCPFCAEDIKEQAVICRFCGMDLKTGQQTRVASAGPTMNNVSSPVVTTQFTSKKYKGQMLIASIVMILGIIMAFTSGPGHPDRLGIGVLSFLCGAFWVIAVRILIWWHHA